MKRLPPYRPFGFLRFLLALMVVAVHYTANLAPVEVAPLAKAYPISYTAVLAFFALSGFIIVEAADRIYQGRPIAFMVNRGLRIVPHFVVSMVMTIIVCWGLSHIGNFAFERHVTQLPPQAFSTSNLLLNFVSFVPIVDKQMSFGFLQLGWTLRIEMLFYAVVMLTLVIQLARRFSLAVICAGATIVFLPLFLLALMGETPPSLLFIPYFALGAAAYAALSRHSIVAGGLAALAYGGITLECWSRSTSLLQFLLLTLLLAAMTWLATRSFPRLRRMDRRMGDITYPLYLCHAWVGVIFQSFIGDGSYPGMAMAVVVSLAVAEFSRRAVDSVIDRLRNRVRDGQTDPAARPGDPTSAEPSQTGTSVLWGPTGSSTRMASPGPTSPS